MKASPVLLLSLGMLASAVPSSKQADTRDVTSNNQGSGLAARGSKAGALSARDSKALSFRRHKQALKRLQRRRAADDDTTDDDFTTDNDGHDTDTDTDDDLAPPPPPPPPPAPVHSTTTTVHVPRPTKWDNDCDTTDTEWEEERRLNCPTRPSPRPKPTVWDNDCDTTDTEWEEQRRAHCPTRSPGAVTLTPTQGPKPTTTTATQRPWDTDTDCDTTDTEWDEEHRRRCSARRESPKAVAATSTTPAPVPPPPATTPARQDAYHTDTTDDESKTKSTTVLKCRCRRPRSLKARKMKRGARKARVARDDGHWTDNDGVDTTDHDDQFTDTDCSDDDYRRNCETAARTTTILADATQRPEPGVTVTPSGGDNLPEFVESGANSHHREAVGGAVAFAGLVAAVMAF